MFANVHILVRNPLCIFSRNSVDEHKLIFVSFAQLIFGLRYIFILLKLLPFLLNSTLPSLIIKKSYGGLNLFAHRKVVTTAVRL